MRRSGWITGVVVAHFLCGALFLGTCIFLLILIRYPEVKQGENAAETIWGLKVAAVMVVPLAVVLFVSAWGLWKNKLWGWWLALLTDAGLVGIFVYSMIDDGLDNIDWDMAGFTVAAFVLAVMVLAPPVRRFYWAAQVGPPAV